jgi:hypothetical protein
LSASGNYCREVCPQCPWRVDQTGKFPANAFLLSANTAHDMSMKTFGCHMASLENPMTCAGFLLRGADDNLKVRTERSETRMIDVRETPGVELHETYKAMAVANGCNPDDPGLSKCMPEARDEYYRSRK